MPMFQIKYTSPGRTHAETIEWITETSWDSARTHRAFEQRHPDAAILQIKEVEPAEIA